MSETAQREGVIVRPERRLSDEQIRLMDGVSRDLLYDPGLLCYNAEAVEIFQQAGAVIEPGPDWVRVRVTEAVLDRALSSAPSRIVLGARRPENRLLDILRH